MCLILNMTEKITCMLVNRQTSKMNENKTDMGFLVEAWQCDDVKTSGDLQLKSHPIGFQTSLELLGHSAVVMWRELHKTVDVMIPNSVQLHLIAFWFSTKLNGTEQWTSKPAE